MNWLAHLLLSPPDPEFRLGNIMADWVKGERRLAFSPGVRRGFDCHLAIDRFTDQHACVHASIARIQPPYRRYAGVLVDVFYDYVLSQHWRRYCDQPRAEFIAEVYTQFAEQEPALPPEVARGLAAMRRDDWLACYGTPEGVALTLQRVGRRLRPGNLLGAGAAELLSHLAGFEEDFAEFFPQLRAHVARHLSQLAPDHQHASARVARRRLV